MASQEAIAILNGDALMDYVMNERVRMRKGNRRDGMAPHNCYRCRGDDNWISIAVANDREWKALCSAMDKEELARDARFSTAETRWRNQDQLDEIIGGWTADRDYYELMHHLQRAGVAATPSLSNKALFEDPHIVERKSFTQVEHPVLGKDWVVAPPWRLSDTPASIRRHGPLLGEHTYEIFERRLGMSREEIERLEQEQVIY
jgi:benzylsuccinate CoA-transferase BbsF subunit